MSNETRSDVRFGEGVLRPGARPIKVHVGDDGEYWLCDADVDPAGDLSAQGCVRHSDLNMAEGG